MSNTQHLITDVSTSHQESQAISRPRCIIFIGRGARGKSFLARFTVEYLHSIGVKVVVVDGDRLNPTTLGYFPEAHRPETADEDAYVDWCKSMLALPITTGETTIIDLGASADSALKTIFYKLDLVKFYRINNVIPILIHCIGADLDDLAGMKAFEMNLSGRGRPVFAPDNTIVAVNAGVTRTSAHVSQAFVPIVENEVYKKIVARGAKELAVEYLSQALLMNEHTMTFKQALNKDPLKGKVLFDPIQQFEILEWYEKMINQLEAMGLHD